MRSVHLLPASLLAAALATGYGPTARADILVNIDKNTQSMSVAVDGAPRYVWPVSTGRAGYDTPNGTFRPNRMDHEHLSQEWDNAPMPHAIFFDLHGHAIHGFLDTRNIGSAASHGCVRLSPEHAAQLYELVSAEGMKETTVVISGRAPVGRMPEVARRRQPVGDAAGQPVQLAPGYDSQAAGYQQPADDGPQFPSASPGSNRRPVTRSSRPSRSRPTGRLITGRRSRATRRSRSRLRSAGVPVPAARPVLIAPRAGRLHAEQRRRAAAHIGF